MSDHARLSLSWSSTWMTCSAWPRIVEGVGDEINDAIIFGNDSHKILENALMSGVPPRDENHVLPAKEEMTEADCAQVTFDYAQDRWVAMGLDDTTLIPEAEVKISTGGRDDLYGTADIVIYNKVLLEIIDHKTGQGTYVCERNSSQLKLYALAAMETFGMVPERVRLTIVQPRYWGGEDSIRTLEITPKALREWRDMAVLPAAAATDNPAAPGTVTENCLKCAGRHVCEFRDREVAHAIGGDGHLTTHNVTEIDIRMRQDNTVYDNPQLAETLNLIPVIRDYCDALEEHASDIIQKGEQVPGYKVVASGGRQKWVDEEEVKKAIYKTKVAKDSYNQKLKTPKQVLALVPPTNKKLMKKLEGLIGTSAGGLALVMDSDPRESAVASFAPINPPAQVDQTQFTAPVGLPDFLN